MFWYSAYPRSVGVDQGNIRKHPHRYTVDARIIVGITIQWSEEGNKQWLSVVDQRNWKVFTF